MAPKNLPLLSEAMIFSLQSEHARYDGNGSRNDWPSGHRFIDSDTSCMHLYLKECPRRWFNPA